MNGEYFEIVRLPQCDCCRRTLNTGEGDFCRDCRDRYGPCVPGNSWRDGLSTPIGELPEVVSERRARYMELVALLEKWSNEPGDYDERVSAILDEALAGPDFAGEVLRISADAKTLSKIATVSPPPQEWWDETENPFVPRTPLGERLAAIRRRMLAAGQATISWEELDRELAE